MHKNSVYKNNMYFNLMRKIIPSIILLVLVLNVISEPSHRKILSRFMDKSSKELFQVYHLIFKKDYTIDSELGLKKYKIFKLNVKKIKDSNSQNLSYTLGINQFSDLTEEEFKRIHLVDPSFLLSQMDGFLSDSDSNRVSYVPIQDRLPIDWSKSFQDARNQGGCGSCWAFATAGASEANWWNSNQDQKKIYLSTQQLVDCDKNTGGCNGGWFDAALDYVQETGLVEEKNYPYKAVEGNCNVPGTAQKYAIKEFKSCYMCNDMNTWYSLLQKGPIAVALDASGIFNYQGGIMKLTNCGQPNHAVIAIGWNRDQTGEYLILRNSWSTYYGENGNFRVYFNDADKTCGLTFHAFLPIFAGNPPPPPPPPSNCFSPSTSFIFRDEWKLPAAFNATLQFIGNGTDFQVATFDKQNGIIAYTIKIAGWNNTSTKISKDKDFKTVVCQWDFSIDPIRINKYSVAFSSKTGSIILTVNGVSFSCRNNANSKNVNVIAFAGNAITPVNICNTTLSPNNQ